MSATQIVNMVNKDIFFALQKRVAEWMKANTSHYSCNWQSFDGDRVFENFTVKTISNEFIILLIYYRIGDTLENSDFYTYKHLTSVNS